MDISTVLLTGAGFLADAYDLFVINVAVDIMAEENYKQALTSTMKASVKSMALVGAIFGQLFFGSLADVIGRRKVFIMTCALVILGALLSATVTDTGGSFGIYSQLCLWRFVLGFGIGGEYPLSAAITSESTSKEQRAKCLAMVFSMQGFGTVLCALVLILGTHAIVHVNAQWRFVLGMGGVPMALAFYFRWKMHETTWAEESIVKAKNKEGNSMDTSLLVSLSMLRDTVVENRMKLLGTAGTWFILDIVFYANGLFSGQVSEAIGGVQTPKGESVSSFILQIIALPGYFFSIVYCERIGLKKLQESGFLIVACLFAFFAIIHPQLKTVPALYLILYGITFFFQNFGPNTTSYIIPSVVYSTTSKGTCHGISAAAGKLGAVIGAYSFVYATDHFCSGECDSGDSDSDKDRGVQLSFGICSIIAFFGLIWSRIFTPICVETACLADKQSFERSENTSEVFTVQNPLKGNDSENL